MGDNLRIRKFQKDLLDLINGTPLPVELKRMTVNDILIELTQVAEKQIQQEIEELEKERKEKEDGLCSNRDSDKQ